MTKTQTAKLSEQVRRAVEKSGMSRYAICKAIGMHESVMSRFMTGKGGLQMDSLDALGELLGLKLMATKPQRKDR
jgi:ribosome-binding protein aMBF1 (putative translation factor)